MTLTTKLCKQIRHLPERKITLYIRLDEEVPRNSCTAYEVDWNGFVAGKTTNLFTIFRICTCPDDVSRPKCIAGTFASACLYPYTVVLPGETKPTFTKVAKDLVKCQNDILADDQGRHSVRAPFRPVRLLLDRPEDVCTQELQYYLTRMGLTECLEVSEKLRELHDAEDLDFFPHGDLFNVPSVASVLRPTEPMEPIVPKETWNTGLPFSCLQNRYDPVEEMDMPPFQRTKLLMTNDGDSWDEDDGVQEIYYGDSYDDESSSLISDFS